MSADLSSFDPIAWSEKRQAEEERLYTAACKGDDAAAAALQYWRAHFGRLESSAVEAAVHEGAMRDQMQKLGVSTRPNAKHKAGWSHAHAFGIENRKRGKASKAELLELRHAFGHLLTLEEDLRDALTTEFGEPSTTASRSKDPDKRRRLDRVEWPATVGEAKKELVCYVKRAFKGTTDEAALAYACDSFSHYTWWGLSDDELIEYPADW